MEHIFICSDDFTDDCPEVNYRHNLIGAKTRKRKKTPDAVPTIFETSLRRFSQLMSQNVQQSGCVFVTYSILGRVCFLGESDCFRIWASESDYVQLV